MKNIASVSLTGILSIALAAFILAPAAQAQEGVGPEMKKELKLERQLSSGQFYNVNAPYLDPDFAPTPGVVNAVMRAMP